MKHVIVALAVLLLAAGCSKYEVYGRNLQYLTTETFEIEKNTVVKELDEANSELAAAQASGDQARIANANERYKLVYERAKVVNSEERRRNRPNRPM